MMELCKINLDVDGEGSADGDRDSNGMISSAGGGRGGGTKSPPERTDSLSEYLLLGPSAEEAGMWLIAAASTITLVCNSCRYSAALVSDLQEGRGYDVFKYMVHKSGEERRPELLSRLAALVGK